MTDAKGLKLFRKGLVGGVGGLCTGGGQVQPEQERPEPGVPTNRGNGLGTMLHHNHSMLRSLVFLGWNETATPPQSIRNNNHKKKTIMVIMTMMPDSVWLHHLVPFHSRFGFFLWFVVSPSRNETTSSPTFAIALTIA